MPEKLQEDKMLLTVYKTFNYKDTVNSADKNDALGYGTVIASCDCDNFKYLHNHHGVLSLWETCE